jgi:hypothetical protein
LRTDAVAIAARVMLLRLLSITFFDPCSYARFLTARRESACLK